MRTHRAFFALAIATAAALTALVFVPSAAAGNRPIAGAQYSGTIVDTSGVCDEGQITLGADFVLQISDYGWTITSIRVSEVTVAGFLSDPQDFTLSVNASVGSSGAFTFDIHPISQILVHTEGVFDGDSVSGSFRVEMNGVLECGGTFSGTGFAPEPIETTFTGQIEETGPICGPGTISITRSADRLSILAIAVDSLKTGSQVVSGSAHFDEHTVPVSPNDGTFSTYFPGRAPGQEIAVSGRFPNSGPLFGAVDVSPSACFSRSYHASPVPGHLEPSGLPSTGAGPSPRGTPLAQSLAIALAAIGAGLFAAAFALRHNVRS